MIAYEPVVEMVATTLAVREAGTLSDPAVGAYVTVPVSGDPLARKVTAPVGAAPLLCVFTVTEAANEAPRVSDKGTLTALMVVAAGVMTMVGEALLAL